jgi:SAM-dependent methyltransferase
MSYSSFASHRAMVFDTVRNSAYAKAIQALVTPDSVVLDLGAGLGILGLLAAQAGAKKVYLVEPEPVGQLAREFARASGLADRIVVLQGRIEDIELPEQVDLILSVFTGNLLFSEDLLPSLFHARDRYLKPGGHLLPDRAELLLAPLEAPDLHATHVAGWSQAVAQLDFAAARNMAANEILWMPQTEVSGLRLGPETVLCAPDFMNARNGDCSGSATCRIDSTGLCHGLLAWFRIRLGSAWLTTDPRAPALHWMNAVLPLDPPLPLRAGETVTLGLRRPQGGDWTWTLQAEAGLRRHSEFLARVNDPRQLRKAAPDFHPQLDLKGKAAHFVLGQLDGSTSNAQLAQLLLQEFPGMFKDQPTAQAFVLSLVKRFATGSLQAAPQQAALQPNIPGGEQ